ncbi:hypothetical protein TcWFU_006760 [Taenia crassiceps]|uniref:Uncharacterized protein n=1 Tax=Taenia crassiceps TaxID=6207 RepID=A0ABR4QEQ2_9CEST
MNFHEASCALRQAIGPRSMSEIPSKASPRHQSAVPPACGSQVNETNHVGVLGNLCAPAPFCREKIEWKSNDCKNSHCISLLSHIHNILQPRSRGSFSALSTTQNRDIVKRDQGCQSNEPS